MRNIKEIQTKDFNEYKEFIDCTKCQFLNTDRNGSFCLFVAGTHERNLSDRKYCEVKRVGAYSFPSMAKCGYDKNFEPPLVRGIKKINLENHPRFSPLTLEWNETGKNFRVIETRDRSYWLVHPKDVKIVGDILDRMQPIGTSHVVIPDSSFMKEEDL